MECERVECLHGSREDQTFMNFGREKTSTIFQICHQCRCPREIRQAELLQQPHSTKKRKIKTMQGGTGTAGPVTNCHMEKVFRADFQVCCIIYRIAPWFHPRCSRRPAETLDLQLPEDRDAVTPTRLSCSTGRWQILEEFSLSVIALLRGCPIHFLFYHYTPTASTSRTTLLTAIFFRDIITLLYAHITRAFGYNVWTMGGYLGLVEEEPLAVQLDQETEA